MLPAISGFGSYKEKREFTVAQEAITKDGRFEVARLRERVATSGARRTA